MRTDAIGGEGDGDVREGQAHREGVDAVEAVGPVGGDDDSKVLGLAREGLRGLLGLGRLDELVQLPDQAGDAPEEKEGVDAR